MDDTAQTNQQQDTTQPSVQQPPQTQGMPATQQTVQAPGGIAAPSKEHAPIPAVHTELIKPAPHEASPEVSSEVAAHVEVSEDREQPQLTEEHRKLGLREAGGATPAPTNLSDDTVFPLTKAQVEDSQSKTYSVWDSFRWFGAMVGRQMLRAHKKLFR
ncbi:MAG: hypothetical protein Q8Q49_02600 [bacterium]|nr:hypothetical protein [bacterium]